MWKWNPGKFPSFCTSVLKMYNFGQIPSAISVDWAVFRTFLDFTKMWTRWNFESIFLKIVHQKGLFDAIKENPNLSSCRRILDIYRQPWWKSWQDLWGSLQIFKDLSKILKDKDLLRILQRSLKIFKRNSKIFNGKIFQGS